MKANKFIRIAASLVVAVTMMLSLSSCVIDFGFSFDDYLPEFDFESNFGENILPDDENKEDNKTENEGSAVFYPGSGNGSIEGVDPLSKTLLSTVTIICGNNLSASAGSGVIYSIDKEKGDAYIITNCHVVYTSNKKVSTNIKVYLYGMELSTYAIPATFVGGTVTNDIAVIKITGSEVLKNSYATAAEFASSDDVRIFDRVYAVGNAEGGGLSATEGIISVPSENITLNGADESIISLRVIRIDAAVNHGNSGGGLYNGEGKLIGIVSAKEVSEDIDNMGYAIPSDLVKKLTKSIIEQCNGSKTQISKALMGVTITAYVTGLEIDENGLVYEVELVEVMEVSAGSIAEGKVNVGDVISSITVDGVKTNATRVHHVTDAMIDARLGSVVVLEIVRDGKPMKITFNITESALATVK